MNWKILKKWINNVDDKVEKLQLKINTKLDVSSSSYQTFVAGTTGTALDAAFGSGNEDNIYGIGKALMLYAQYNGESASNFTNLCQIDNLNQLTYESCVEVLNSASLLELFNKTAYGAENLFNYYFNYTILSEDYNKIQNLISNNSIIKESNYGYQLLTSRMTLLSNSGTYTIPKDRKYLILFLIGGGGSGGAATTGSSVYAQNAGGGGSGYYQQLILNIDDLSETINFSVGSGGAAVTLSSNGQVQGNSGESTIFDNIEVKGGGGGTGHYNGAGTNQCGIGGVNGGDNYTVSQVIDDSNFLLKADTSKGNRSGAGGIYPNSTYSKGYGSGGGGILSKGTSGAGAPGAIFIFN